MARNRTYLVCHMMCSVDGKITSGTGENIFDDEYLPLYDEADMEHRTQGWMCGRVTMEMFAETSNTPLPRTKVSDKKDFISNHLVDKFAVGVDSKGVLRWKSSTIKSVMARGLEYSLIVIVTEDTPAEYLSYLHSKDISCIIAGTSAVDWALVLEKLYTNFGIKRLSLQGGGRINGSLLKAGLIDELSLLIIPLAVNNSKAPAVFEHNVTPETFKTYGFELKEVKQLNQDVVWLLYSNKITKAA